MSQELQLQQARANLNDSLGILIRIRRLHSAPTADRLWVRFSQLGKRQLELEKELEAQMPTETGFIIPLIIGAAALGTSYFGLGISKQLTESTDYKSRLQCIESALEKGLSQDQALSTCGFANNANRASLMPALLVGGLVLIGVFLLKK